MAVGMLGSNGRAVSFKTNSRKDYSANGQLDC